MSSGAGVRVSEGKVRSFQDLDVYKRLCDALKIVSEEIIPKLPSHEKFDLADQIRRASKAPIAILAEGYAKRSYNREWLKYINDCIGECNEMMAHLGICKSIYIKYFESTLLDQLVEQYDICGKQLYRLGQSWQK